MHTRGRDTVTPPPPTGWEGSGVRGDPNIAMRIAAEICVYTNEQITIEEL
jgi:hypothetical protein